MRKRDDEVLRKQQGLAIILILAIICWLALWKAVELIFGW